MATDIGLSLLERVPVEQITRQAREISLTRVFLTVLAAIFFACGWIPGRLAGGIVWCAVAIKLGWQQGRQAPPNEPDRR